jgi:hypothetical protein
VGSKAGLDVCGKSHPHRDSIPGPSSPNRVAIPTEPLSPTFRSKHSVSEFNVQGSVHRTYIQKMQRYTVYLYLETVLHVSSGTSTHHQERIQLYLQHLVFVTPLRLSAAIVEELEPVWVCCGWRTPPTAHSNRFQLVGCTSILEYC